MPIRDFTEVEIEILQQIAGDWKNRRGGMNRKPEKLPGLSSEGLGQVNDVYIARIPEDGIPALIQDNAATGSGSTITDDMPGYAQCDLFKIGKDATMIDLGLTRRVWNVSTASIAEGWAIIQRTKFGNWIAGQDQAARHYGILLEDVAGSSAPLSAPNYGTVRLLAQSSPSGTATGSEDDLVRTDVCVEAAYRFTVPDLEGGSLCKVEFLAGEWSFYTVDCEDSGLSTAPCGSTGTGTA
jgi:hypothetical protein